MTSITGIKRFIEECLEHKLNTYLQESRLDGAIAVFREYQHEIEEQDRHIEVAAKAFLPENWTPPNDTLTRERGEVTYNQRSLLSA